MAKQLYGSFQNRLLEAWKGQPEPVVGMDVTFVFYSDRAPGQIVRVEKNKAGVVKKFWTKPKDVKVLDYFAEKYEIGDVIQDAAETECKQRRNGQWVVVSHAGGIGAPVHLGFASYRDDPSF